jgi:hypothetical protein
MQYNFSDPESRIMPGADGFVQAYNTQIAVEPDFQWIVGQRVTQATNDKQQLAPTVKAVEEQAGQKPQEVLTDSGYCSEANLKYLEKKKIEGFIATDKESYRDRQQPGPRGPLPQGATRVDRMRRKLQTKVGAAIYSRRKTVVERMRTSKHTVDGGRCVSLKIGRGVYGGPSGGSEIGDALDGDVGESGHDVGEIVADRNLESSAAFDHGEDCGYARSGLLAADVDPVLSARRDRTHGVLGQVIAQFQFLIFQEKFQALP